MQWYLGAWVQSFLFGPLPKNEIIFLFYTNIFRILFIFLKFLLRNCMYKFGDSKRGPRCNAPDAPPICMAVSPIFHLKTPELWVYTISCQANLSNFYYFPLSQLWLHKAQTQKHFVAQKYGALHKIFTYLLRRTEILNIFYMIQSKVM
jgi:hypothetical protein